MTQHRNIMRELREGTKADRVLWAVLHPLFEGATAREIATELRLSVEYVTEQMAQIATERSDLREAQLLDALHASDPEALTRLIEHANAVRALIGQRGYDDDATSFLHELLIHTVTRHNARQRR